MNVSVRTTVETLCEADIGVYSTDYGDVRMDVRFKDGSTKRCFMTPDMAVKIYRCFLGELESCMVEYRTVPFKLAGVEKLCVNFSDKAETWSVSMSNDLFVVNADQAMAMAWAIEKCVADSLSCARECSKEKVVGPPVWVLSCRRVLTGDSAADGVDLIGGHEEVFSSEEKARDRLREFMRPLVNEALPDELGKEICHNVDDILDKIIEDVCVLGDGEWAGDVYCYEGAKQAFRVELVCKRVDET